MARVVHYFPVAEDDVKFAAGGDKLVLVYPRTGMIQGWDLTTFQREVTHPLPFTGTVNAVAMGSLSRGPLFVSGGDRFRGGTLFLDIQTMKPIDFRRAGGGHAVGDFGSQVRASADGRVFGFWRPSTSPQGIQALMLTGGEARGYYCHDSAGHVVPGPDGNTSSPPRPVSHRPVEVDRPGESRGAAYSLPAQHGDYYLTIPTGRNRQNKDERIGVYLNGDARPLCRANDIELWDDINPWDREKITHDKRIHFIPDARVIVTLPPTNDRLILYRLDVEEALEKSGIDYLIVTSRPPAAVRGTEFSYQLKVKSKKGVQKYRVDSGPPGMAVFAGGRVSWAVPADYAEAQADVILTVVDAAGQETFHTFRLAVLDPAPAGK